MASAKAKASARAGVMRPLGTERFAVRFICASRSRSKKLLNAAALLAASAPPRSVTVTRCALGVPARNIAAAPQRTRRNRMPGLISSTQGPRSFWSLAVQGRLVMRPGSLPEGSDADADADSEEESESDSGRARCGLTRISVVSAVRQAR